MVYFVLRSGWVGISRVSDLRVASFGSSWPSSRFPAFFGGSECIGLGSGPKFDPRLTVGS